MQKILLADLSIILVEPSDTQRKIISTLLHKENVENVNAVSNVKEAIEAINKQGADLVVSSMYLEDGTGVDILKSIKNSPEHCSIPFMLVSSENRPEKLEEFKQAGVAAMLPKPFSTENLSRALKASLDLINTEELDLNLFDVRQVRVLLVDDSKLARNHIKRVLQGLGIEQIIEAENGASALTKLKEHTFDLVVTDYNMPEMDGRELSEFIRFNSETSHIPIIMVTSESVNSLHMANIHQTGVNALCDKPFEVEQVKMLLISLLEE
ncbi:response regulator [Paraglaciecola chathamensis]|jgi:two-component system chemotaxis response regulator CheY|uniref:Response regulator n=3 Tax=Paraglaciecola chathamensis TaxID=368405 RepID=A0A8H9IEB8_9ALTE|nr:MULTISPECIES: response regulator [Paraglaciecola]MBN28090.1 response regulator [Alteromonadaceae bacterium]MBJ2138339.1 response regulator [Paraglaciecola chathamensis]MBU3016378.1 response regulator [Paraglaciecola agarilytica]MDO6559988.1 response regulator [Paraglaciecola chathamensis]MDO6838427.1 response regulator [Paraglaciecola chathamensis]|tara:strand:- start:55 stop:855 length:801 start_codon:yes stop_codon:yes gene_type:complete